MLITNSHILVKIGRKIREKRQELNMKLHEVAEEAQISKGLLSKIENARTIPSLPVLISIIKALRVDLSTFFSGIEIVKNGNYVHKKKNEYLPMEKEEALGFMYQFILSQNIGNLIIQTVILDLTPESRRDKVTTDGFEFKYILKGIVEYHIGEEVVKMEEGDSLWFNGRIPHVPVNVGEENASMLVIYFLSSQEI